MEKEREENFKRLEEFVLVRQDKTPIYMEKDVKVVPCGIGKNGPEFEIFDKDGNKMGMVKDDKTFAFDENYKDDLKKSMGKMYDFLGIDKEEIKIDILEKIREQEEKNKEMQIKENKEIVEENNKIDGSNKNIEENQDKNEENKNKKIKKLIAICTLSSFVFIVATYAWFIGMRSVNVSSFDIEIASTDSLLLSLDGSTWDTTVTINEDNFQSVAYTNNVNNWANYGSSNAGLKPISSIGEIDTTSSTMKMYEKGSLTATPGGYRLMASRIHNYETEAVNAGGYNTENGGYVAFDLFVRNFSGQAYYSEDNELNEEAIYLTTDSEVTVGTSGVSNTGIENSVRVAFAQIGRVNGRTTDVDTITGIKCVPETGSEVTGICRTAQIWEPNDTNHVVDAISYYNTSCRLRPDNGSTLTDITLSSAYTLDSTCGTIEDGNAYSTYAIARTIDFTDKVDVYDGTQLNGYTTTTRTDAETGTDEVAFVVGTEPVNIENLGSLVAEFLAHVEPVLEIVTHVITAERKHSHGVTADNAYCTCSCSCCLGSHSGTDEYAVLPAL